MEINKEKIEKIAQLAKLDLSEDEKEKYLKQFPPILNLIKNLDELDIFTDGVLGLEREFSNQLRDDEVVACTEDIRDLSLQQAPELENNQIKVQRVL